MRPNRALSLLLTLTLLFSGFASVVHLAEHPVFDSAAHASAPAALADAAAADSQEDSCLAFHLFCAQAGTLPFVPGVPTPNDAAPQGLAVHDELSLARRANFHGIRAPPVRS